MILMPHEMCNTRPASAAASNEKSMEVISVARRDVRCASDSAGRKIARYGSSAVRPVVGSNPRFSARAMPVMDAASAAMFARTSDPAM